MPNSRKGRFKPHSTTRQGRETVRVYTDEVTGKFAVKAFRSATLVGEGESFETDKAAEDYGWLLLKEFPQEGAK